VILNYQQVDSILTLEQGLDEYRSVNPDLRLKVSSDAQEFFECHDIVHVIFACDTSLLNEAMADTWTLFGTSVTMSQFFGFLRIEEHKEIITSIGWLAVCATVVKSIPMVIRIALRSMQMTKRWPWDGYQPYMQTTLRDIRNEFGIQPIVTA